MKVLEQFSQFLLKNMWVLKTTHKGNKFFPLRVDSFSEGDMLSVTGQKYMHKYWLTS